MAQVSSQSVANGSGAAVRAAINLIFGALFSSSSGAAAPSPTVAGMFWFDTTNLILKQRNNANTAWINVTPETIAANSLWGNPTGAAAALQAVSMAQLQTMLGISGATGSLQVGGRLIQWAAATTTATGVTVTFPQAFSAAPRLQVTPNATVARLATFQSLTATSVLLQCWDTSGAQVAQTVQWLAIGDA